MTKCKHWAPPTLPSELRCKYRIIAQDTEGFIGTPICVKVDVQGMRCCRESEYSIKIGDGIYQELPERETEMGAPIPTMQRIAISSDRLQEEVDSLSESLANGHNAMNGFNEALGRWTNKFGDIIPAPQEYRHEVAGRWSMGVDIHRAEEDTKSCNHYVKTEEGSCQWLYKCFQIFGVKLDCPATVKKAEVPTEEHRKLEVV